MDGRGVVVLHYGAPEVVGVHGVLSGVSLWTGWGFVEAEKRIIFIRK